MAPELPPGADDFDAPDGTRLAYRRTGGDRPLVVLPGGPMRASSYLGDLGGLVGRHPTVLLDLRGTGRSAVPADPTGYRSDRQVEDVEALRGRLGLERFDLAGHSAGAGLALQYAARYPQRVRRIVLITPSSRLVGLAVADEERREIAELRRGEAWFPPAYAAFERIWAGEPTGADWRAIAPFMFGRWDAVAQRLEARQDFEQNAEAAAAYYGPGGVDPARLRRALSELPVPVLVVAGEYDASMPPTRAARYAALFPAGETVVLPRAGHYPWLDGPEAFVDAVTGFLGR